MSQPPAQPSNRLIHETSPYLLQHAHNPVDWYPWGEEAFQTARQRDKPVLLSIGYSACHWCHVMERECFENPRIAELMNRLFVNIKVDREERPDVDALYMNFVQMTTGSGGWPLTVFLAPDQLPFFGGTYFPPDDRYGRPGFPRILETLARAYHERGDELEESRGEILRRLQLAGAWDVQSSAADESVLADAASQSLRHLDPVHGGFGPAPKFPSTMVLGFLLRRHRRAGDDEAMRAVRLSLDEMAKGGIFDHFGGGFHRYSVDERWLVPHFEKMLYDNALLARLYVEAFQCTEYPFYRQVAAETLEWVLREMTDPSGGFYSALDADSEGEEGKFYVWTPQQVDAVLSSEESRLFKDFYDISAGGNFEGSNIPHHRYSLETFADKRGLEPAQLEDTFARCRRQLLDERGKRIRPGLDDKILTAWNGMMLAALAEAGWALKRDDFIEAARRNAAFLDERAVVDGRLRRSWKDGHAKLNAYVEDYACAVEGWLALYAATGEPRWLDLAANMTDQQIELFWDRESGDFYFTSNDHERLLVRNKEFTDNATPSGNSTSCRNLLLLGTLLEKEDYLEKARTLLSRVGDACRKHPLGFGNWLQALDFLLGPADEIVLVGSQERRSAWEDALRRRFLPNKVIVSGTAGEIRRAADRIPLLEGKADREGAYVCRNSVCRPPVESAQDLLELL